MKFGILPDIHGNLEALRVVLEDARQQHCTHYPCIGQVVGYGANPRECVELVRKMNMPCVKGNHDDYSAGNEHLDCFNPAAAEAVQWTRKQLRRGSPVAGRPEVRAHGDELHSRACHTRRPATQGLRVRQTGRSSELPLPEQRVCFFGHPHVLVAFVRDSMVRGGTCSKFKVEPGKKCFVNVGAVGQPRAGNPKAAYVVYDTAEGTIELRRVQYDIAAAQKKIREAGLPEGLAERLAYGR